jgi:hypothetical protein
LPFADRYGKIEKGLKEKQAKGEIMTDLSALYKWFDINRDQIIADHTGECVLLKDNSVIDYYPNTEAALSGAQKHGFTLGEFLIQDCKTKDADQLIYYNQAVTFG